MGHLVDYAQTDSEVGSDRWPKRSGERVEPDISRLYGVDNGLQRGGGSRGALATRFGMGGGEPA